MPPRCLRAAAIKAGSLLQLTAVNVEEKADEDDRVLEQNGVKLILDSYSQRYLRGANIDYVESLMGSGFKINNPNVTKSCSCGHSFTTE